MQKNVMWAHGTMSDGILVPFPLLQTLDFTKDRWFPSGVRTHENTYGTQRTAHSSGL